MARRWITTESTREARIPYVSERCEKRRGFACFRSRFTALIYLREKHHEIHLSFSVSYWDSSSSRRRFGTRLRSDRFHRPRRVRRLGQSRHLQSAALDGDALIRIVTHVRDSERRCRARVLDEE